ncbi:hypothetical protein LTR85_005734 [Meristemomyces frigidus]|nr:hypothetical protein LTR85_005734 [Meristemomyces frigidus]
MQAQNLGPQTPMAPPGSAHAHDEPSAEAGEKRKRQPRNSACQPCASLKMKCVASNVSGKCERCHRMDRECIPSVPKPRKRRTLGDEDSPAAPGSSRVPNGDAPASAPTRLLKTQEPETGVHNSLLGRSDLSHNGSRSFAALLGQGLGLDNSGGDLLRGIDYNYVQMRFTIFRQLTGNFPFVSIRPDADAVSMAANRPMTTAAICTVASAAQPEVQERLVHAFRLALSAKVIVQGERTIDLLVGLLIYLAWHHNYMSKQQIYQELYLLAGMAADLGLYRQRPQADRSDVREAVERDRAYLGCYYLCCSLSVMGFNKPSPLRWTDNLRRCAESVAYSGAQPSDRLLLGITELVRTIEDLEDGLRVESSMNRTAMVPYVEMHTKSVSHRLKALKREHPELGGTLGLGAATIHFHHRLLRASETPDTATLIQCACAIKEHLDDILDRPPITLHQVAIVDWTNLLEILVLMAQVAKPLPNTVGWEAGALTSMPQPEAMLYAICNHMASAPVGDSLNPRHEARLQWFRGICDSIKKRILRERIRGSAVDTDDSQYDTVHSLGQNGAQRSSDSRFRSVNEPYNTEMPLPGATGVHEGGSYGSFNLLDKGVLDDGFWSNFLSA